MDLKIKEKSQISSNTYFQIVQNEILLFQVISIKERYFPKENTLFFLFQKYRGNSIISNYFGMNNESQR